MCKFIVFVSCSILFGLSDCTSSSSYDQRQTGDFNVHIGLKNIQLIALLKGGTEEYVDYDYAYDYSEMTIKPQHGSTQKPPNATNTQIQSNVTEAPAPITQVENTTESNVITTVQRINGTELSNNVNHTNLYPIEPLAVIINETDDKESANHTSITTSMTDVDGPTTVLPGGSKTSTIPPVVLTPCRRGFIRNGQGKCEYQVHGTTNALRRIVKLAQKIKIARGIEET